MREGGDGWADGMVMTVVGEPFEASFSGYSAQQPERRNDL